MDSNLSWEIPGSLPLISVPVSVPHSPDCPSPTPSCGQGQTQVPLGMSLCGCHLCPPLMGREPWGVPCPCPQDRPHLLTALPGPQYSMHCCVLGFLSCSLFLHMSFELKLLLLLLWLTASCSIFLHSHAWLSDCLIARLYLGTLDSRCAQPLHRWAQAGMGQSRTVRISLPEPPTGQREREAEGCMGPGAGSDGEAMGQP